MKKSGKNCTLYHMVNKQNTQTFDNFKNFADFFNVCSANILVLTGLQHQYIEQYKENQNLCSTKPIPLNVDYSVSWSKRKWT